MDDANDNHNEGIQVSMKQDNDLMVSNDNDDERKNEGKHDDVTAITFVTDLRKRSDDDEEKSVALSSLLVSAGAAGAAGMSSPKSIAVTTAETDAAIPLEPSLQRHLPFVRPGAVAVPGPNIGMERDFSAYSVDYCMGSATATNTSITDATDSRPTEPQQQQPDSVFDQSSDDAAAGDGEDASLSPPPPSSLRSTTSTNDYIITAQVVDEEEIQRQVQKEIDRRIVEHERMLIGSDLSFPDHTTDATVISIIATPLETMTPQQERKRKILCGGALVLVVLVIAGVVVALVVLLQKPEQHQSQDAIQRPNNNDTTTGSNYTTATSSNASSSSPAEIRFNALRTLLQPMSGADALQNTSTPQYSALQWLAQDDTFLQQIVASVPNSSSSATLGSSLSSNISVIIPRYCMALLYYATNGPLRWNNKFNFLSGDSICSWNNQTHGVFCNMTNRLDQQHRLFITLKSNGLKGTIPQEFWPWSKSNTMNTSCQLEHVDLSNNVLTGSLFHSSSTANTVNHNVSATKTSRSQQQQVSSSLHPQEHTTYLHTLDLSHNQLQGSISLAQHTLSSSLRRLNLWENNMTGTLPTELGLLTHLTFLDLSQNTFGGSIPPGLFQLCSQLEFLDFYHNSFTGTIPSTLFANNNSLQTLTYFGLGSNQFHSTVPNYIWQNLSKLTVLNLFRNHFTGTIPTYIGLLSDLGELDFASNHFNGTIPTEIGSLQWLFTLDLSSNRFTGTLPYEISQLPTVLEVHLNDNLLGGAIPDFMWISWTLLWYLELNNNSFTGSLPTEIDLLKQLYSLDLSFNHFNGTIPSQIGNKANLEYLYLNNNNFTGSIPFELGLLPSLSSLDVAANYLEGTIPSEFGSILDLVDLNLGDNTLNGTLPPTIGSFYSLVQFNVSFNKLTGTIPRAYRNLGKINTLALDHNMLSGTIPPELRDIRPATLYLEHNNFTGSIPEEFCNETTLAFTIWADCTDEVECVCCDKCFP